ncbi:MAG: RNA 2',3'-cyclic phosphodiesterase [Terriglobia bacterium]
MRLFVAIDLTPEIHAILAELMDKLRPTTTAMRWTKPEGLHLTLKFIGETPDEKLDAIRVRLANVHSTAPVEMRFRDLGFFPNERQPRVFWVGIEATPNLAELAAQVETELAALGIPPEKRPFVPHLTLGRFRAPDRSRALQETIRTFAAREFGRQTATEFFLYQSQLSPRGASYKKLERFEFTRHECRSNFVELKAPNARTRGH